MAIVDVSDLIVGIIMLGVGLGLAYFSKSEVATHRAISLAMMIAAIVLVIVGLIFIVLSFVAPGVI